MKNIDIITLANTGALAATAHDLPVAHAYKLIAFKRAVRKQLEEIVEREKAIKDDPREEELRKELYNEEITLEGVKTMPFEVYHALARENRAVPMHTGKDQVVQFDPFTISEDVLEGVLWVAPEE